MIKALFNRLFSSSKSARPAYQLQELYDNVGLEPSQGEELYLIALTHSSFTKKLNDKNERLEFLGDAVINFAITEYLYFQVTDKDEGTMTKMRASIVNRKHLNKVGNAIGIAKHLRHKLLDGQLEKAPDIIGNAFEALMGAYFLDYGMHETATLVCKLLVDDFDESNYHKSVSDPKSFLLEWAQAKRRQVAFFHAATPDADGLFRVELKIDDEVKAIATGKNKREAEYHACVEAIKSLEL